MLSIIIPVYNEEANLGKLIDGLNEAVKEDFELIVVDDGSTDNSARIALDRKVNLIRQAYQMGNGAAIKRGIREAKGDMLLFMDGDGQHNPEDIACLLKHIDKYDMVVGARTKTSHATFARRIANKIYNCFASYVTQFKIEDLTSGFRVIKKPLALQFLYLLPNGFSYPTTLTLAILKTGRSIKYISLTALSRGGKSKINTLSDGIRFLLIITKIATIFSPFRVFLPVSLLFFTLGLANYTYTFLILRRFTNMSALLFTTSVTIFMLGLISEQISQMHLNRTEVR